MNVATSGNLLMVGAVEAKLVEAGYSISWRDFHAKATVLGCIVKDETSRSRTRQIEWNRREFMCSDSAVRITDPDGTSTSRFLAYIPRDLYENDIAKVTESFEALEEPWNLALFTSCTSGYEKCHDEGQNSLKQKVIADCRSIQNRKCGYVY
ncbi:unnamed protein product [Cylicocyclus nassatus]|uniref:Uncharacterized protein n=1 Tax=Cylicocyclus nassatus TaxID=53992 RepID=A0AA36HBB7_CYLNA|nr:unnamed protein product [Cylicocyclus nassatus]